ncbi:MAG TPA: histidine kinase dimerization/phospho-acceptor domain-containing protein [Myxococcales bacterium]|nr:histidine kinase dimerization/phospho-acceptor domain-containing protein [Myxococcales bacterium]
MPSAGNRRGKYLGFVAHEIKNPLATALWSCDLLKRMDSADRAGPRAEKMVDASLRALRRMRRLVDDYFTIERLREHGYELHSDDLELRALVDGAIAVLAEKDGVATQSWSVDVPGTIRVTGDNEMLRRGIRVILEHMAQNGAGQPKLSIVGHATSPGGELVVGSSSPPSPIVPLAPEERPSGDPAGTVLGYALADAIVRAHGGSLQERDGALVVTLPKR